MTEDIKPIWQDDRPPLSPTVGRMFTGWPLTDRSRVTALKRFPATHKEVVAHHVTDLFGVAPGTAPPTSAKLRVVGLADRDGLHALAVEVKGSPARPDGGVYHLTVSHAEHRRFVDSNALMAAWPCITASWNAAGGR